MPNAQLHVYEGGHMFAAQDGNALREIDAFLHIIQPALCTGHSKISDSGIA
jgi:hypothetical protein